MSRKITKEAAAAFFDGENFGKANTCVRDGEMFLRGNKIAKFSNLGLHITTAGWNTTTTRERLNGLLNEFGVTDGVGVYTKKGQLMLGDSSWDGEWHTITRCFRGTILR